MAGEVIGIVGVGNMAGRISRRIPDTGFAVTFLATSRSGRVVVDLSTAAPDSTTQCTRSSPSAVSSSSTR